ncbi:MAG: calcium:proton antiporter [Ktedonobacteraceae bacterium]|jgi:Ca2+:H+ antiporter
MPRWLYFLLIFTVLAPILDILHVPPLLIFLVAGLGILPLAALIGLAVEQIAEHTGERIGGLLFATFGNATELIIGILALSQGLVQVVSASIIGSIIANVLLVLGVSVCVGGFKHGRLQFDGRHANQYGSLLGLSIAGLLLPTVAELLALRTHQTQVVERGVTLSDFIAVVLLLGYVASILFSVFRIGDKSNNEEDELDPVLGARSEAAIARLLSYRRQLAQAGAQSGKSGVLRHIDTTVDAIIEHETEAGESGKQEGQSSPPETSTTPKVAKHEPAKRSFPWLAVGLLAGATVGVAWLSDILVSAIEPVTVALHWNAAFVGLVFVPLIGGLPEYFNTISMALDKRIGMVLAASAGSSIQIALLVAPILVLLSLVMPHRLDLVFSIVELAVLALATFLFGEMTKDGELVWLEGLLLVLLYVMMGGTVFIFGA